MLHLLKLEWLKQKNFTVFRVIVILYLAALPGFFSIGKSIDLGKNPPDGFPSIDIIYMFPKIWTFLGYGAGWMSFFFLGFLSILMVTNERNNKTMRQNIITGLTRKEYFLSKLYFIFVISACAAIYFALVALAYGFTHNETIYLSTILKDSDYILKVFLSSFAYMSFGLFLGILIKRTGIAVVLYFAYGFFLEKIVRYGVHYWLIVENKSIHFYPVNSFSDLTPVPVAEFGADFLEKNDISIFLTAPEAIITSLIYVVIFLGLSYRILKKSDL